MNHLLKKLLYPAVILRRKHDNYLKKHNPEKLFSLYHKRSTGKPLDLKNPKTLHDKIAYLAFHTDTTTWSQLADKIKVRDYVINCGYPEILTKLYGTYSRAEDIDYDVLPKSFVLKTNNASATNILVKDKNELDIESVNKQLNTWLKWDYGFDTCQPHYSRIEPLILAEEYLVSLNKSGLIDYKFYCFNGRPLYVQVMTERMPNTHTFKLMIFDMNWEKHPEYCSSYHEYANSVNKPRCFDKMVDIAVKLSTPFVFVRVDFYEINDNPILGEMTFTPGFDTVSDNFNKEMGEKIIL